MITETPLDPAFTGVQAVPPPAAAGTAPKRRRRTGLLVAAALAALLIAALAGGAVVANSSLTASLRLAGAQFSLTPFLPLLPPIIGHHPSSSLPRLIRSSIWISSNRRCR